MSEYPLVQEVYKAKDDLDAADQLIERYIPYILKQVSNVFKKSISRQDEVYHIGLVAFHEAILSYDKSRGNFLSYANLVIRSRVIDFERKQHTKYKTISLDAQINEDHQTLYDVLSNDESEEQFALQLATRDEILELGQTLERYHLNFSEIAENSPKQERTLEACRKVLNYACDHPEIIDEVVKTKKLPLSKILRHVEVERKTVERHRKYLMAMMIIQSNGFELMRQHLYRVIRREGNVSEISCS